MYVLKGRVVRSVRIMCVLKGRVVRSVRITCASGCNKFRRNFLDECFSQNYKYVKVFEQHVPFWTVREHTDDMT